MGKHLVIHVDYPFLMLVKTFVFFLNVGTYLICLLSFMLCHLPITSNNDVYESDNVFRSCIFQSYVLNHDNDSLYMIDKVETIAVLSFVTSTNNLNSNIVPFPFSICHNMIRGDQFFYISFNSLSLRDIT